MAKRKAKEEFIHIEFTKPWIHSHQLGGCAVDDPKANVFFSNSGDSKPYSAGYYATDNYACDVRIRATGEVVHHANWAEKRGQTPKIPDTAMFVARCCEERLRQATASASAHSTT